MSDDALYLFVRYRRVAWELVILCLLILALIGDGGNPSW